MTFKEVKGFSEVFALYDGFIFDLWGVIHDGVKPLPGSIEVLEYLRKANRRVWLLSNAPRRASTVIEKLTEMGISPSLYDGVLTSGEMTWQALDNELINKWGRKCFHLGPDEHSCLYEGLDIELAAEISQADFILNSGVFNFTDSAEQYFPLLEEGASYGLPMLCANPDKIVHIAEQLVVCSGSLAEAYENKGGEVVYFGKPYREAYRVCLRGLGVDKVLATGDAMITDVKGAFGAGIDSLLVLSGIHRDELATDSAESFIAGYPYSPNYIMQDFVWDN